MLPEQLIEVRLRALRNEDRHILGIDSFDRYPLMNASSDSVDLSFILVRSIPDDGGAG